MQLFLWVLSPINSNNTFFFFKWKKSIPKPFLCYFQWILTKHRARGAGGENEVILIIQTFCLPSSTVIMCPSLSSFSLDHGKWKIVNGSHYEYGTRIIFTCNPGYYRVGPAHIQCLANGVWSWRNERPRCKSKWLLTAATKKKGNWPFL